MFNEKRETENDHGINEKVPHWPRFCQTPDCDNKIHIALIEVETESGIRRKGCFSQFGFVANNNWLLRDGYKFICWHTYCADCYQEMCRQIQQEDWRDIMIRDFNKRKVGA